jgi:hypothetical protein
MHLLLPIRHNQPPLLAGRRHGREPCTTTLVDVAPLNRLALAIRKAILATISMATRLRRLVPPSGRLRCSLIPALLWSLVGRSLWDRSLMGQRLGGPRLVGSRLVDQSLMRRRLGDPRLIGPRLISPRLVDRSLRRVHLRRSSPVVGWRRGRRSSLPTSPATTSTSSTPLRPPPTSPGRRRSARRWCLHTVYERSSEVLGWNGSTPPSTRRGRRLGALSTGAHHLSTPAMTKSKRN